MAGTAYIWEVFLKHHFLHECLQHKGSGPMKLPSIFGAIEYTPDEQKYIEHSRTHMAWLFKQHLENAQNRNNIRLRLRECGINGLEVEVTQLEGLPEASKATSPERTKSRPACNEAIVLRFTTPAFIQMLGDHDIVNKKLHHWQAEYGKLFRKYREVSTANKSYKRDLEACQKKLERFKALEDVFNSMKEELRELHAQHETDAGDILEWKATSKDLERQCLQQQAQISDLKNELASLRRRDVKVDQPSKQQAQGHRKLRSQGSTNASGSRDNELLSNRASMKGSPLRPQRWRPPPGLEAWRG